MQAMPDAGDLPVPQPPPAGHAAAVAQFLGQLLPRDAGAQDVDNAVEGLLIADARPPSLGRRLHGWNQGFDALPQRCRDLFATSHTGNSAIATALFKPVLLGALSTQQPVCWQLQSPFVVHGSRDIGAPDDGETDVEHSAT